ncbi:glycosyltransferase family 4 protein [candidate division KSB1 bacterium]|nr:glycosyltransferase family 4 protein [candidate division KSB1 bacterium]
MKILHVIYDDVKNPWVGGGGAVRALEINRLLAQKNNTIYMITGNFPGARSGQMENMQFVRIGFGKYYLLSRLSFAVLLPFYLRKYEFDIVVNEFSVFSPAYCHWYTKKPVVHTFYHKIGIQALKKFFILGLFAFIFEKIFLATARNIITISPSVTKDIENKKPGSGLNRRIECIYTGVDRELFDVEPQEGEYIAFIGRLDIYMKGIDILLEAFKGLSGTSVELRIAGSGPKKNRITIENYLRKFEIADRVSLLGRISDSEKKDFLAKALFCVMPSRYEGWGIAAIEASSCAKPVIGTKISGLQDAIIDGKTGLLVEPENPGALTSAMQKLLSDKDLRLKMGKSGREWARNFEWESIAEKQYEFYEEVCAM